MSWTQEGSSRSGSNCERRDPIQKQDLACLDMRIIGIRLLTLRKPNPVGPHRAYDVDESMYRCRISGVVFLSLLFLLDKITHLQKNRQHPRCHWRLPCPTYMCPGTGPNLCRLSADTRQGSALPVGWPSFLDQPGHADTTAYRTAVRVSIHVR